MAASSIYSDRQLHGKTGEQRQEMLWQKGINWNDYPAAFKRGSYVQRCVIALPFSAEELSQLPPQHNARLNPGLLVERSYWRELDMPPFGKVTNREAVIFDGAKPITGDAP